jgi:hypothetical protein
VLRSIVIGEDGVTWAYAFYHFLCFLSVVIDEEGETWAASALCRVLCWAESALVSILNY